MRRFFGRCFTASFRRGVVISVDAKSFEPEVLQSQDAVCVVFSLPGNAACQQFIECCDRLSEQLNAEANAAWLKLCVIDGDTNRNLASAMAVQRAKLPTTFFVMQSTIIDKVVGNITEQRLENILRKFCEHYHTTHGMDMTSKSKLLPLAAAQSSDLTSGAPTSFLQKKIATSLVGAERIKLPEEAAQMEGIKKLIQQTKQKSFEELEHHHRAIGLDVKRLSDEELEQKYFSSEAFKNAATMTALEALFLARVYGSVGQMEQRVPQNALSSLRKEFAKAITRDAEIRMMVSLVEVNIIRGKCRERLAKLETMRGAAEPGSAAELAAADEAQYIALLSGWVDYIDSRRAIVQGSVTDFPSSMLDSMFTVFKKNMIQSKKDEEAAHRAADVRVLIMGVLHMFPADVPECVAARSRLSSMMF